jgi:hypothetical protein
VSTEPGALQRVQALSASLDATDAELVATKKVDVSELTKQVTLGSQQSPDGLGIAFGAELTPSLNGEVMLCTPDTLIAALERVLA